MLGWLDIDDIVVVEMMLICLLVWFVIYVVVVVVVIGMMRVIIEKIMVIICRLFCFRRVRMKVMMVMIRVGIVNDFIRMEEMKVRVLCEGRIVVIDYVSIGRVRISLMRLEVMCS